MNLSPAATLAAGIAAREQYARALRGTEDGTLALACLLSGMTAIQTVGFCIIARRALAAAIRQEAEA